MQSGVGASHQHGNIRIEAGKGQDGAFNLQVKSPEHSRQTV
jgi:hypothetical protein